MGPAATSLCLIAMSLEFECIVGRLCYIEMGFTMLRRHDCFEGIKRGQTRDLISPWQLLWLCWHVELLSRLGGSWIIEDEFKKT